MRSIHFAGVNALSTVRDPATRLSVLARAMSAVALGGVLLLAAGSGHAQTRELSGNGILLDRIAAVVNDGVVLRSELEDQVKQITERLRAQRTELPPQNVLRQQIL